MNNVKDDIAVPSNNYPTRLKFKYNVIVPKMRKIFGQHFHKYMFSSLVWNFSPLAQPSTIEEIHHVI